MLKSPARCLPLLVRKAMRMPEVFRLGTRGSLLALTQSRQVANAVFGATGVPVELVVISTRGDEITDRPLPAIGGKGLFTMELEHALRTGAIDFAVHSLKDLPTDDPDGLVLGAVPQRVDPRDALVGYSFADLPPGSTVATGSLRRRVQLAAMRPDLTICGIRGNVPTRLKKRDDGLCDATVLAMAGLERLAIDRTDIYPLSQDEMVPAVGQGALAVQCRSGDERVLHALSTIEHTETRACVQGERAFLEALGGGCNVPAGCNISPSDEGSYSVVAVTALEDGTLKRFESDGQNPVELGWSAFEALR